MHAGTRSLGNFEGEDDVLFSVTFLQTSVTQI